VAGVALGAGDEVAEDDGAADSDGVGDAEAPGELDAAGEAEADDDGEGDDEAVGAGVGETYGRNVPPTPNRIPYRKIATNTNRVTRTNPADHRSPMCIAGTAWAVATDAVAPFCARVSRPDAV
jgi:hypothetical protein